MESSSDWLEVVLKKNDEGNSVAKVLSVDVKPATKKGDNYMSDIKRIKMEVLLKSGKKVKKSVIVKCLPLTEFHQEMLKEMSVFAKEIMMYRDVIPLMEDVLIEYCDYTEPMWATLIDYRPNDILVFHDLNEKGYLMGNRKEGLDLEHSLLVMRSLAKFHATSIILQQRGFIPMDIFSKHMFELEKSKEMMKDYYDGAIQNLINTMDTLWEPEWKPTIEKLKTNIKPKVLELVLDKIKYNEKKFNVLNHGDCWVNNMLFKYGMDSTTPISVKFVDLQICFFGSPAYDLQYFLSSSLSKKARQNSLEELLKTYHKTLVKQLELYSYKGDIITYEQLIDEFNSEDLFGLMIAITLLPFVYREETDESFPEIEDVLKEMKNQKTPVMPGCKHPMYTYVVKDLLKKMMANKSL